MVPLRELEDGRLLKLLLLLLLVVMDVSTAFVVVVVVLFVEEMGHCEGRGSPARGMEVRRDGYKCSRTVGGIRAGALTAPITSHCRMLLSFTTGSATPPFSCCCCWASLC